MEQEQKPVSEPQDQTPRQPDTERKLQDDSKNSSPAQVNPPENAIQTQQVEVEFTDLELAAQLEVDQVIEEEGQESENRLTKYKAYFAVVMCCIVGLVGLTVVMMVFGINRKDNSSGQLQYTTDENPTDSQDSQTNNDGSDDGFTDTATYSLYPTTCKDLFTQLNNEIQSIKSQDQQYDSKINKLHQQILNDQNSYDFNLQNNYAFLGWSTPQSASLPNSVISKFTTSGSIKTKNQLSDRLGAMFDFLAQGNYIPITLDNMLNTSLPEECESYRNVYEALMGQILQSSQTSNRNYVAYLENDNPHSVIPFIDENYK